eukprot:scaffold23226_cov85-Isochrysis_galbana.AAC.3
MRSMRQGGAAPELQRPSPSQPLSQTRWEQREGQTLSSSECGEGEPQGDETRQDRRARSDETLPREGEA